MDKKSLIELKLKCLYYGIYINESTVKKLQNLDTYFVQGLFSHHKKDVTNYKIPNEIILPYDIVVQIRNSENSPVELISEEEKFFIKDKEKGIKVSIKFPKAPKFYEKLTSDGTKMYKVIQLTGKDCLKIYTSNYCEFEKLKSVCKFCTVDSSRRLQDVVYNKNLKQIVETFKEAKEEGYYGHVMITAGTYPTEDRGLVFISEVLNEIRKETGLDKIYGSVSTVPPKDMKYIETIYNAGIEYLTFNLEVYDEKLFKKYCPGKDKYIGREHYFKCYERAVEIFGAGKVRSNFVAGIEPLDSLIEGFEVLAKMGVVPTVTMLSLNEKNQENMGKDFKLPDIEYYKELYKNLELIYRKYNMKPAWCEKCRTTSLEHEGKYLL